MGIIHGAASRGPGASGAQLIWRRALTRSGMSLCGIVRCHYLSRPFWRRCGGLDSQFSLAQMHT